MASRINPSEAKELARLHKKRRRRGLSPREVRRVKKLTRKVNAGLWDVVEDIHKRN